MTRMLRAMSANWLTVYAVAFILFLYAPVVLLPHFSKAIFPASFILGWWVSPK